MSVSKSNQEIFNLLSRAECELFYMYSNTPSEELKTIHQNIDNALKAFAKLTGCHN